MGNDPVNGTDPTGGFVNGGSIDQWHAANQAEAYQDEIRRNQYLLSNAYALERGAAYDAKLRKIMSMDPGSFSYGGVNGPERTSDQQQALEDLYNEYGVLGGFWKSEAGGLMDAMEERMAAHMGDESLMSMIARGYGLSTGDGYGGINADGSARNMQQDFADIDRANAAWAETKAVRAEQGDNPDKGLFARIWDGIKNGFSSTTGFITGRHSRYDWIARRGGPSNWVGNINLPKIQKKYENVSRWNTVISSNQNSGMANVSQNFTTGGGAIRVQYDHEDLANTTTVTYGTTQTSSLVPNSGTMNFSGGVNGGSIIVNSNGTPGDAWSFRVQERQMVSRFRGWKFVW